MATRKGYIFSCMVVMGLGILFIGCFEIEGKQKRQSSPNDAIHTTPPW